MMSLRVTISDDLRQLADHLEAALLACQKAGGDLLVAESRAAFEEVRANASGQTSENIAVVEPVTLERAEILAPSPSKLLEEGRPAGKVPPWSVFEPILIAWAQHKGIDATRSLYPIAVKIRRDGYPGRFPFKLAVERAGQQMVGLFAQTLRAEVG